MKFKLDMRRVLKGNLVYILILLSLTLCTRLILIMNAPFIYYFDSYSYMLNAVDLFSPESIRFGVGMPLVIFLGAFCHTFGYFSGPVIASRLFMLLTTVLLVYVFYSLGLKMAGKAFGFLAGLLAIFEPFTLSYSIVPHSDVFAVTMGLAAVYFATSAKKSLQIFSPIFFFVAVFTKSELYLTLVIPLVLFYVYKIIKKRSIKASVLFACGIVVYILPVIWLFSVTQAATRFNVIEKFSLFLTPELLTNTLDLIFRFYDQPFLNQAIFVLLSLGLFFALLNVFSQFVSFEKKGKDVSSKIQEGKKSLREVFLSDGVIVAFMILLVFVLFVLVVTAYGYGYVIIDGELIITNWLPDRYLILPRLLLSYPLAYTLFAMGKKVYAKIAHQE